MWLIQTDCHWRIQGEGSEGASDQFLSFSMRFSAKTLPNNKLVSLHIGLTQPWEILDPPLTVIHQRQHIKEKSPLSCTTLGRQFGQFVVISVGKHSH